MLALKQNILFIYRLEGNMPFYPMENYVLIEILGNLIDNAIEAAHEFEGVDKKVILEIGCENEKAFLEVKNTGKPINIEMLDKIFKKGYSTKENTGRGYGLYNVKMLAQKYKASIEVSHSRGFTSFRLVF